MADLIGESKTEKDFQVSRVCNNFGGEHEFKDYLDTKYSSVMFMTCIQFFVKKIFGPKGITNQKTKREFAAMIRLSLMACGQVFEGFVDGACEDIPGGLEALRKSGALSILHEKISDPVANAKLHALRSVLQVENIETTINQIMSDPHHDKFVKQFFEPIRIMENTEDGNESEGED